MEYTTLIEDNYNPGIIYATLSSNLLKVSGSAPFISGTLKNYLKLLTKYLMIYSFTVCQSIFFYIPNGDKQYYPI